MATTILLTEPGSFKHKVSSTLNGSSEFASKHMFDDSSDNCWNSAQGSPQFILIDFTRDVQIHSVQIMFQGGFVGQDGVIEAGASMAGLETIRELPDINDSNDEQVFSIAEAFSQNSYRYLKITFRQSTDFYGRITIYSLKVLGHNV